MELLREIKRSQGIPREGATVYREAVRGIILKDDKLLMIRSSLRGDYKFPGGGCLDGETQQETLIREIREECGAVVTQIGAAFGKVTEYDHAEEPEFDVFKMTSFYYQCQVSQVFLHQILDDYEAVLGFEPVWIKVDTAIQNNKTILNTQNYAEIFWLQRESYILEEFKKRLFPDPETIE